MIDPLMTAGQVLVAGFFGLEVPEKLRLAFAQGSIGGVTFFGRNITNPSQLHGLICELDWPKARPPLLAIDQEGGRVARLKAPVAQLPPMRRLGEIDDPSLTRRAGSVLGRQLRAIGLTMNFAPVLDVDTNPDNPIIGDRSFGRTPETVARHACAFADGLAEAPLLACGKHFPGHGDTLLDSHLALPSVAHPRERLRRVELAPFRYALDFPAFMTAHVVFPSIDPVRPATFSPAVVGGLLRKEIGYEGCIISDDVEMNAVAKKHSIPESAALALEAGCDIVLVCSDLDACLAARAHLAARAEGDAVFRGRLEDAAARSLALRRRVPPMPAASLDSAFDESAALEADIAERA